LCELNVNFKNLLGEIIMSLKSKLLTGAFALAIASTLSGCGTLVLDSTKTLQDNGDVKVERTSETNLRRGILTAEVLSTFEVKYKNGTTVLCHNMNFGGTPSMSCIQEDLSKNAPKP
jgi:hypothetical protein